MFLCSRKSLLHSKHVHWRSILTHLCQLLPKTNGPFSKVGCPKHLLADWKLATWEKTDSHYIGKTWILLQYNCITCQLGSSSKWIRRKRKIQNISKINRSSSIKNCPLCCAASTVQPRDSLILAQQQRAAAGVHQYLMCAGRGISVERRRALDTETLCLRPTFNIKNWRRIFPVTDKAASSQRLNNLPFPLLFCLIVKCLKGLNRTDDFDISVSLQHADAYTHIIS